MKLIVPALVGGILLIIAYLGFSLGLFKKISSDRYDNPAALANELIFAAELNQAVDESLLASVAYMKNPYHRDPAILEQRKKTYAAVMAKFEKNKENISKQMYSRLSADLQAKFTPQEMVRLIEAYKSLTFKKFMKLQKSDEYVDILIIPNKQIKEMVDKESQEAIGK